MGQTKRKKEHRGDRDDGKGRMLQRSLSVLRDERKGKDRILFIKRNKQ